MIFFILGVLKNPGFYIDLDPPIYMQIMVANRPCETTVVTEPAVKYDFTHGPHIYSALEKYNFEPSIILMNNGKI